MFQHSCNRTIHGSSCLLEPLGWDVISALAGERSSDLQLAVRAMCLQRQVEGSRAAWETAVDLHLAQQSHSLFLGFGSRRPDSSSRVKALESWVVDCKYDGTASGCGTALEQVSRHMEHSALDAVHVVVGWSILE